MKRILSLALVVCAGAFAQNAALMPLPRITFVDANGAPLAGGYLRTCTAGSACTALHPWSTPANALASYTDATAGTPAANPIVLDAGGSASVWLGSSPYKIVLTDANGVVVWTQDNVSSLQWLVARLGAAGGFAKLDGSGFVLQSELNYNQGGTGAANRTVQSKEQERLSVLDFGADKTGATDAGPAIQLAVNAAGVGSCVVFPAGTYLINTTITLKPQLCLRGEGATLTTSASIAMFSYVKTNVDNTGFPGEVLLDGFVATGTGAAGSSYFLKIDANFPFVRVAHCDLRNFGTAIYLRRSYASSVDDSYIAGVTFGVSIAGESHAFTAKNVMIDSASTAAFAANYAAPTDSPLHNVNLIGGAYQHSAVGVWIENTYGFHSVGTYHETNTAADFQLGVSSGGTYARAAYNSVIDGMETSSAATTNIVVQEAVNFRLSGLSFLAGCSTTGTLVSTDGFSAGGIIDYFRHTTTTPTATAPFNLVGNSARNVVVAHAGNPIFPSAMTAAIQFGTLASPMGKIYQGSVNGSGRNALTLESDNQDLQIRAGSGGLIRMQDNGGTDIFQVDALNSRVTSVQPLQIGAGNATISNSGNIHVSSGGTTTATCTLDTTKYMTTTINGTSYKLAVCQ